MWDLSSPSRDQTPAPCLASRVLTTGLPGKSQFFHVLHGLHLWFSSYHELLIPSFFDCFFLIYPTSWWQVPEGSFLGPLCSLSASLVMPSCLMGLNIICVPTIPKLMSAPDRTSLLSSKLTLQPAYSRFPLGFSNLARLKLNSKLSPLQSYSTVAFPISVHANSIIFVSWAKNYLYSNTDLGGVEWTSKYGLRLSD